MTLTRCGSIAAADLLRYAQGKDLTNCSFLNPRETGDSSATWVCLTPGSVEARRHPHDLIVPYHDLCGMVWNTRSIPTRIPQERNHSTQNLKYISRT